MPVIVKGDPRAQLRGMNVSRDKQNGWRIDYDYEGLNSVLDALIAANTSADSASKKQDGPVGRAVISYATSEPVTGTTEPEFDVWELEERESQADIFTHPKTLSLSVSEIAFVRYAAEEALKSTSDYRTTMADADAQSLYDHVINGLDSYLVKSYVLRRTTTVSSLYTGNLDFVDTHKIWSTAQVKTAETLPTTIQFDLDDIDTDAVANPLPTGGALDGTMTYGWLKKSPVKRQTGANKFSLVYEYWHAIWSTWIYGLKT